MDRRRITAGNTAWAGFAAACITGYAWADVLYVDADAGTRGAGTSWEQAFLNLQSALAIAAPGDEIWVAAGSYTPSDTDAAASFILQTGVALYGGFAGTESSRDQRDWSVNETILSGDIGRDDIVVPWPSGWNIMTRNSGHVVVASNTDRTAVLDGFTIANGHTGPAGTPAGHELMFGSGVYMIDGSPTIRHCRFTHNLAAFGSGGGIYCLDGNPLIEDCDFNENYVHGGGGGAILVYGDSVPVIRSCNIRNNISVAISPSNIDGDAAGIGIYCSNWVTISDCVFEGNVAQPFYSVGDELGYGGGLWVWNGGLTVEQCVFRSNRANFGAGFMAWGPADVINCLFQNNTAFVQPNDPYPENGGHGAGVAAMSAGSDIVNVINCTVAYNHGRKYVGVTGLWNARVNVFNSIVRNNDASNPDTANTWKEQVSGFNDLAYCNISYIFQPDGPGEDPLDPADLPGVIDDDPLFTDASPVGNLRLAAGSPCIDAGDNSRIPVGTHSDLDGNVRLADDPDTTDTGSGPAPVVDMGAFEFGSEPAIGDIVAPFGLVDLFDLLELIANWGTDGPGADIAPPHDVVDVFDLLELIEHWG